MPTEGAGDHMSAGAGAGAPAMLLVLAGIPIVWIVGLWFRIFSPR